ncbi:zinc finger, CCHC-type containing protein [Tanacetum coccineum]
MAAAMKHMASNFAKLKKFEGVDFRIWQKKIHFLLFSMSVVYVLTTSMPEDGGDNPNVDQNVETSKELWDTLEAKYMVEDASSKKFLVYTTQDKHGYEIHFRFFHVSTEKHPIQEQFQHTLKQGMKDELNSCCVASLLIEDSLRAQDNDNQKGKNLRLHCQCGSMNNSELSRIAKLVMLATKPMDLAQRVQGMVLPTHRKWVDSGATVHVCKDRCWFKIYESLNDGSILHMGNESTALAHGRRCVDLRMQDMYKDGFIPAFDMDTEKCKTCMLTKITKKPFQNVKRETEVLELIHSDLCDVHATPSLGNKKYFVTFIDDASRFCYVYLLHSNNEALDKFKVFKTEVELQQGTLIKRFRTDRESELHLLLIQYVCIIHETTTPYTPQQNGISERKNRVLKEMVNSMLSYSWLSQGFWNEAMAVVRLPDQKLKTLGERGIKCIFVGYGEHSKAFRFYVIEPNDSVAINSIIESRDAIFDENRFSSVPRPSQRYLVKGTEDSGGSVVSEKVTEDVVLQHEPELRKSKRHGTPKDFGPEFQLYLIEGTRDEVSDQHSYCFNIEDDPKNFDKAMKSQDVAFCKNCNGSSKRKLKVDGTIEKFKARLVIQGFKQKSGIDYFNNYALVACISTIRLLIAMASIHKADKCVYSKFDKSGKGVIICIYVDDMLIFGTDQVHVDLMMTSNNVYFIASFIPLIMEYLVNISKRRAFWSLNKDILKITIVTTNTPYPSRKIRRIRACTHQRPQRKEDQYVVSNPLDMPFLLEPCPVVKILAVLENMDAYRDEGMGDFIFGEPFLREVGIKTRRFEGMITIYNGNDEVTYQMVRSHPRFKHHTNEQCNKIPPIQRNRLPSNMQDEECLTPGTLRAEMDNDKVEEKLT